MSVLVRGRQKAVPVFKGLFAEGHLTRLLQRSPFLQRFPEVRGKIGNRRAQRDFMQQNRRSRKRKTGVWSTDLGFTPHFRI